MNRFVQKSALSLILQPFLIWVIYLIAFVLQKPIFFLTFSSLQAEQFSATDLLQVMAHGWAMDACMSAYLTTLPLLLTLALSLGAPRKAISIAYKVWFAISSFAISFTFILDLGLYPSWGFRLDSSPLFYFLSSPSSAVASVSIWQLTGGLALSILYAAIIYVALNYAARHCQPILLRTLAGKRRMAASCGFVLACGLLFIAMRGGVTVSTMNLSRAYFSSNKFLNDAALNPSFSLIYSLSHQQNFDKQFRYMDDQEVAGIFSTLHQAQSSPRADKDSLLTTTRPDVYIVILESFSAELFPSLGGDKIAVKLDSVARSGINFTDFYANGFRTDRGVPAILSGFPGAPTASVMKFVEKTRSMPGIASSLANHGWESTYYYGGDINFTNMLAYLINTGFRATVRDTDFPLSERTGKWGAHDHLLFARVLADAKATPVSAPPQFRVVQTSSSHEPFEVPANISANKRINAFAYTDSVAAEFVNALGNTQRPWVAIFVADHYGAWPEHLNDLRRRHHIPCFITGSALRPRAKSISTTASQADIAPTLLSMLGIAAPEYEFGTDILDPDAPHYAFFYEPGVIGIKSQEGMALRNTDTDTPLKSNLPSSAPLHQGARAYLQTIYNYFQRL